MRRLFSCLLVGAFFAAGCSRSQEASTSTPSSAASKPTFASGPTPPPVDRSKVPAAWKDVANDLPDTWVASLGFLDTMMTEHGTTLEKVTCHCCNKSLATCYRETLTRASGACPPL